jgi:flagellar biosynthesis protein FlhG
MPDRPDGLKSNRKLGRGLSQVSHVFLSGVERQAEESQEKDLEAKAEATLSEIEDFAYWMPDAGLISVTSGDGVRGKTLIAGNLGVGLYWQGRRVAVINADSGKPDILDITRDTITASLEPDAIPDQKFGSMTAVDLDDGVGGLGEIEAAARQAQFVIIDTGPRAQAGPIIWKLARLVIVLTEPTTTKMRASYAAIKRVYSLWPEGRIGLVVNMAKGHDEAEQCFRKISSACRHFLKTNLRNYGYVNHSDAVKEASEKTVPLIRAFPESKAARCIDSILRSIVMDESAIAKRRREVTLRECALKGGV